MKIFAKDEATRLFLYHLAKVYFPLLSDKDTLVVSAKEEVKNGAAAANVKIAVEGRTAENRCFASIAEHFSQHRAESVALAKGFMAAANAFTPYLSPYGTLTGVKPVKIPLHYLENGKSETEIISVLINDYFVSPEKAKLVTRLAALEKSIRFEEKDAMLYVSIPFCPTRCSYCSFISSSAPRKKEIIPQYLVKLKDELHLLARFFRESGQILRCVYIGGGTPGILSADETKDLISALRGDFDFSAVSEFCVEAGRPDTFSKEKLAAMKDGGVNRISINPQTLHDELLEKIGRKHSVADFYHAFSLAREVGFRTLNCDLIAGLPGDSAEGFSESVRKILDLAPENITLHAFARKNAAELAHEKYLPVAGQREAMDAAHKNCIKAGFAPYYLYRQKNAAADLENTGFAKEGHICLYNLAMMEDMANVFSAGAGSVTRILRKNENGETKIIRLSSYKYPYEYLADAEKTEKNIDFLSQLFACRSR